MSIRKHSLDYLWNKAISDKNKAQLSFELLLNNGVGIGDHSTGDYHENLDQALDMLEDATDRIDVLKKHYGKETDNSIF